MKKILFAVLLPLLISCAHATSTTTVLGLALPELGTYRWDLPMNANSWIVDLSVAVKAATQTFTGANTFISTSNVYSGSGTALTGVIHSTAVLQAQVDAVALSTGNGYVAISNLQVNSAMLASTQTFTGQNTFGKLVTFSSSVYTYNDISAGSVNVRGSGIFSSATSTTTFSGWVDIGRVVISSTCADGTPIECTASCPNGYAVTGGGCRNGNTYPIREMYPYTEYSYKCVLDHTVIGYIVVYAFCARIK